MASIDDLLKYERITDRESESDLEYFEKLFKAAEMIGIHKKTALYYVHKQHQMENTEAVK